MKYREFIFKNVASVYARDIDEAKDFMRENFKINDNNKVRGLMIFTNEDIESMYEVESNSKINTRKTPCISWWNI